ncbi:hypothetical protein EYF80_013743 [Liparis tanakae]|uniref:Uncharacterized protein n=1 Tax=Liparis tanakae TaxID=230148 RepID=A0A4Z2IDD6_9TELE|nr:hypothetical protein EYF80_013743 [Liparis tanakae]
MAVMAIQARKRRPKGKKDRTGHHRRTLAKKTTTRAQNKTTLREEGDKGTRKTKGSFSVSEESERGEGRKEREGGRKEAGAITGPLRGGLRMSLLGSFVAASIVRYFRKKPNNAMNLRKRRIRLKAVLERHEMNRAKDQRGTGGCVSATWTSGEAFRLHGAKSSRN